MYGTVQEDTRGTAACKEIARAILKNPNPTEAAIRSEIKKACTKYALGNIPKNHEILGAVHGKEFESLRAVLMKKPAKTASGVAVIALMPAPYACPHGRCTYCPGGLEYNTPNSYTGSEPSTMNAIENNYDPGRQITTKLEKLRAYGHDASKTELVIVGGTFLFMPEEYRKEFVKSSYDALNGFASESLVAAMRNNESAHIRNVGFSIETKPDYCKEPHVDAMLEYGMTRVEIGVQTLQEGAYAATNRGHTYDDVTESFRIAKDAGYKIVAHMMPGLPTVSPEQDIADFGRLYDDPELRPDMLKIYPSLVIKGTPLYNDYIAGRYTPYTDDEMMRVLAEAKKRVPRWARIMRVQREIQTDEIVAGPRHGNIRQRVLERLRREGRPCKCIRCREIGVQKKDISIDSLKLNREYYDSSGGREVFLSYDDDDDRIYGFLRLRRPGAGAHRPEIGEDSCMVRELHVYGRSLPIGGRARDGAQHMGLGKRLMAEARRIAGEEFDAKRILVISAVGTRQYYERLGYSRHGPYMASVIE